MSAPGQPKYRNRKVEWAGQQFDSVAERDDYIALLARQERGEIHDLCRQVRYVLQEGFRDREGHRQRAITYTVDFTFVELGQEVAWDTKGFVTQQGRLREKLFRKRYPQVRLVINCTSTGGRTTRSGGRSRGGRAAFWRGGR